MTHTPTNRRDLLKGGVAGAAAAGLAGCGGASGSGSGPAVHATKKVKWRLASSFPANLDTIFGAATVVSERVEAMTDGNFQIRVSQSGELVAADQVLDAVQKGSVQAGQTAGYYYVGKAPALAFDTCVPFGLTARQQSAWLLEGGGLEQVRSIYADFDIISFPCGNTGSQMGGWFKREIAGLADLKGLTMRIPGIGGKVMARLGVSVQNIAAAEIYPTLERGAIDAAEWVGPYDDEKLGLHKAANNYYYPGWWEPGPSLSFLVNTSAWADLPASYKAIFETAAKEASVAMQTRYDEKNPAALARLRQHGLNIEPFPDEVMRGAQEAAEQFLTDEAAGDGGYAKLLDGWRKFRKDSFDWFGTAELAYSRFAFG